MLHASRKTVKHHNKDAVRGGEGAAQSTRGAKLPDLRTKILPGYKEVIDKCSSITFLSILAVTFDVYCLIV